MPMLIGTLKSKPEVEIQYGDRSFSQTGIITGSIARSTNLPVFSLLIGRF